MIPEPGSNPSFSTNWYYIEDPGKPGMSSDSNKTGML